MPNTITDGRGITRCWWCGEHPDYVAYHDNEWGQPVTDDRRLFEKICLEGFQAGLSWLTILRKRENFRQAFCGFDFRRIAGFSDTEVTRLLRNAGIVRHRGKIESTINNAKRAVELVDETGSLAAFLWQFEPEFSPPSDGSRSHSPESKALSRALKQRGWSFVGPTTAYAFMQSVGMINDHLPQCCCFEAVEAARRRLIRPR